MSNERSIETDSPTDLERPCARSRASNKPCPRAPLLHRVPNERNRVDARALGREWFLESWFSGRAEIAYIVMSCEKIVQRRCTQSRLPHRLSPGSKLFFGTVVGWLTCWVRSYGSCNMEHAAPGSVLRVSRSSNASSGLHGPPAGSRGKDGRIHNDSSRYSTAAQREVAPLCLYICCQHFLYISILCWRAACVRARVPRPPIAARARGLSHPRARTHLSSMSCVAARRGWGVGTDGLVHWSTHRAPRPTRRR